MPSNQQQGSFNAADVIHSLFSHDELFTEIGDYNRTQGDIRQRFLRSRAIRAHYVESKVGQRQHDYDVALEEWKKRGGFIDEAAVRGIEELIVKLDKDLRWHSRVLEDDSRAAQAPVADQYFADKVFRWHLTEPLRAPTAPSGRPHTFYGSEGDPVPAYLTAPREGKDDLFRKIILNWLVYPIFEHIFLRLQRLYDRRTHRDKSHELGRLRGRTLNAIVHALECILAVTCMAGSAALLYRLEGMKDRLIAATLLSLFFPYPVTFLSRDAVRIFTLTAGYWAVMVVFISNLDDP